MYDTVEYTIRTNVENKELVLEGIGAGVALALSATKEATGKLFFVHKIIDSPFEIDKELAWECENVAIEFAELGKRIGSQSRNIGGLLLASVYGLRVLSESEFSKIAGKAKDSFNSKFEFASKALKLYREEMDVEIAKLQKF